MGGPLWAQDAAFPPVFSGAGAIANAKNDKNNQQLCPGEKMSEANNEIIVMVVDDSNTIRKSAEIFLKQAGYSVVLVNNGFDALAQVFDTRPDIIFVDIMMPRLDGYQTCQLIKKNDEFKTIPIVMLSSKDGLFDKAKGRIVGSNQYLTKPFSKEALLDAVRAHTAKK